MSHTLLILKIYTTFKDVQMKLKIFFDISTSFRFSKISVVCSVHLCSCPWVTLAGEKNMSCIWLSPMFLPYFLSTNRENLGIKSLYFSSIPTINLCANKFYGKYVQAKTWRIHRNFPISYQRFWKYFEKSWMHKT